MRIPQENEEEIGFNVKVVSIQKMNTTQSEQTT
jgi:hypothetical protein